ncbi:hypothetical protein DSAG12_02820 [Promethearchaeum syntrophicum]|uniref:Uncharacterized protein n=1 Tax=Promethearchaeum syntrophicum TaxID=2594042 RepID=A0A5B9DCQ2_9ARCH|nr:hypothetical protein [Candidatus Prometheoarchaeum syntrophicum]QEE16988.1 hypothetical protein DSAG12_02820 [Candidatus Prometheoarchaeum syntrophicum]
MNDMPDPLASIKNLENIEFKSLIAYLKEVLAVSQISCGYYDDKTCRI